jgi:crotonobetainyl-CoA:carnitine CoA-transferase CaiB-like acyl-CoA transferase
LVLKQSHGTSAASALHDLIVLEIGHSVAAPFAGQVLGDLGARVIKVENPKGGDDARGWGPPFWHGAAASFQSLNRNKASITIDLKNPDDVSRLRSLALAADVVIQNMRPGLVAQYGLDAESLRKENRQLIYFNLGAFGDVGPLRERPGYDPLMQAFTGIMNITGVPDSEPVRVGPSIVDLGSGMWGVIGILAALHRRAQTGEGCTVDGSLYETALAWMTIPIAGAMASGAEPKRWGSDSPMVAPYKAYAASDGHVMIAAGNDNLFRKLCVALGKPEWADDPRFRNNADRLENRDRLNQNIQVIVRETSSEYWVEKLSAVGVPCAPVQSVTKVISHPQTQALEMISPTPDGNMSLVRLPLRFDGERPAIRSAPPALGADNDSLAGMLLGDATPSATRAASI